MGEEDASDGAASGDDDSGGGDVDLEGEGGDVGEGEGGAAGGFAAMSAELASAAQEEGAAGGGAAGAAAAASVPADVAVRPPPFFEHTLSKPPAGPFRDESSGRSPGDPKPRRPEAPATGRSPGDRCVGSVCGGGGPRPCASLWRGDHATALRCRWGRRFAFRSALFAPQLLPTQLARAGCLGLLGSQQTHDSTVGARVFRQIPALYLLAFLDPGALQAALAPCAVHPDPDVRAAAAAVGGDLD